MQTLQAAAKLPAGYTIDATSIDCWKDWAVAEEKAPTAEQQGDGAILFAHLDDGPWTKVTEGSDFDCAEDLGLFVGADHPSWCRFS